MPQGTKRVVLNGISFSLAPGDLLAIIGNSGAGKTTLGKMLVGSILPTSGNVRLDLMDLRNWDQRQFGENIGYLPQDVQLFPASIKANIARMRDDATDAEIYEAAMLADVHEMIATFPQGYETFVAADGAPLSGGQKQRIALARAFFGNPRMVVLDEPNSNLDAPATPRSRGRFSTPSARRSRSSRSRSGRAAAERRQDPFAYQRHGRAVRRTPGGARGAGAARPEHRNGAGRADREPLP